MVLNFWPGNCPPCRFEMPSFQGVAIGLRARSCSCAWMWDCSRDVTVQTGRASSLPLLSVPAYVLDGEPGFDEFAPRL
ncbi:MAG: peroxiredoxin family protein [Actinomycetota bacterium]|nr:peroxiredoxin family protein [Actinomycetota bacterium]